MSSSPNQPISTVYLKRIIRSVFDINWNKKEKNHNPGWHPMDTPSISLIRFSNGRLCLNNHHEMIASDTAFLWKMISSCFVAIRMNKSKDLLNRFTDTFDDWDYFFITNKLTMTEAIAFLKIDFLIYFFLLTCFQCMWGVQVFSQIEAKKDMYVPL